MRQNNAPQLIIKASKRKWHSKTVLFLLFKMKNDYSVEKVHGIVVLFLINWTKKLYTTFSPFIEKDKLLHSWIDRTLYNKFNLTYIAKGHDQYKIKNCSYDNTLVLGIQSFLNLIEIGISGSKNSGICSFRIFSMSQRRNIDFPSKYEIFKWFRFTTWDIFRRTGLWEKFFMTIQFSSYLLWGHEKRLENLGSTLKSKKRNR